MKYLKKFNESLILSDNPDIFKRTIYRIPTESELENVDSFKLSSSEILDGFKYTIVGRGIFSQKNKNMIIESIKLLCELFPENIEYKKSLLEAENISTYNKFNESDIQDISSDRIEEIISSLTEMSSDVNQKNEIIDSLINELNNFRGNSGKSNDQIDDSISNLQLIRKSFSDSIDKLDNVVIDIKDYNENGRKFLY